LYYLNQCSFTHGIPIISTLKFQKRVKNKMSKKWRLFHATNFQTLMYPCFIFCRILGIFPYKVNNSIFKVSKLHYILSITITCAICVFELIIFFKLNVFTKINFETVVPSLEIKSYCIIISYLAIVTLVLSNPRMRLLQTVMKISSGLSPESYQKLSRLIHAKDIFGSFYLIFYIFLYFYKIHKDIYKVHEGILLIIFSIYGLLLAFQTDMLYINCVCVLKACFKEINNSLLHTQQLIVNNVCESRVLTIFYYKQRNSFLIMKLKALKKQHIMINYTIQMLNMIFSLQLLATTALTLFESSLQLYFHVLQWNDGLVIKLDEQLGELSLIFTIYFIIKMALIVWACETGKNQAQEIRTTIHDVLNSTRDKQIKDEVIKVQFNFKHQIYFSI